MTALSILLLTCNQIAMPAPAADSLRFFIYRSQTLSLYRKFLREIRQGPESARGKKPINSHQFAVKTDAELFLCRCPAELKQEVRRGFESQKSVKDLQAIKFLLSEGKQRLKQLSEMLGFSR